jgi:hypothetical protein
VYIRRAWRAHPSSAVNQTFNLSSEGMMLKSSLINSLAPARQGSSGNDETLLDGGYADPDRVYGVAASALRDENNGFGGAGPASRVSVAAPPEQAAASEQAPAVLLDKTAATPPPIIQTQQTQPLTIDNGGTAELARTSSQAVTFEGTTGTLKLDNAVSFTGQVAGLVESDALDLADVRYGADTTAVFSGNASGGTLTVTDGSDTAHIGLVGDARYSPGVATTEPAVLRRSPPTPGKSRPGLRLSTA